MSKDRKVKITSKSTLISLTIILGEGDAVAVVPLAAAVALNHKELARLLAIGLAADAAESEREEMCVSTLLQDQMRGTY